MSYTNIWSKQFIKVDGRYIPMILSGSSNCTEYVGGREVLEKSWGVWNRNYNLSTKEELMSFAKGMSSSKYELFKENSKWVTGAEIEKWFENAIKKARTLEEIFAVNKYRYLDCYVWMSHKTEYGKFKRILGNHIHTTEELKEWIVEANRCLAEGTTNEYADYNMYIHIGFDGREKITSPTHHNGRVVIKFKNSYLVEYNENMFKSSYNKNDAIIFDDENKAIETIKNFPIIGSWKYRIVSA